MKTIGLFAAVAITSGLCGAWTGSRNVTLAGRSTSSPSHAGPSGDDEVEVTLAPTTIHSKAKKVNFSLGIRNKSGAEAVTRYALEIVSDRGVQASAPITSETSSLATSETLDVPLSTAPLPLGFLMIRATVAAQGKAFEAVQTTHLYLHVTEAGIDVLESHEWMEQSAINEGYDL